MGIYYSSATGYGFIVDQEKLAAIESEMTGVDDRISEALESFVSAYRLLAFDSGHDYDASDDETDYVVVVDSQHTEHDRDGGFGAFVLGAPRPSSDELIQLNHAHNQIGTGLIGPLAIFRCS